jgi:enamine deaminase RidA (YjgF/YER057c/UK114 family)
MTNYADPDSVGAPFHLYSQVSVAGDLVSVAGQVGVDRDNEVVGPDVTSQALQTYENIRLILESQGATLRDVVRFVVYLVAADDVAGFYAAREQYFGAHFADGEYPPNTLLIVQALVKPGLRAAVGHPSPAATARRDHDCPRGLIVHLPPEDPLYDRRGRSRPSSACSDTRPETFHHPRLAARIRMRPCGGPVVADPPNPADDRRAISSGLTIRFATAPPHGRTASRCAIVRLRSRRRLDRRSRWTVSSGDAGSGCSGRWSCSSYGEGGGSRAPGGCPR